VKALLASVQQAPGAHQQTPFLQLAAENPQSAASLQMISVQAPISRTPEPFASKQPGHICIGDLSRLATANPGLVGAVHVAM
jgi:hypothetical protein